MVALTPALPAACAAAWPGIPDYLVVSSDRSVPNHLRAVRGSPGCLTIRLLTYRLLTGFAIR